MYFNIPMNEFMGYGTVSMAETHALSHGEKENHAGETFSHMKNAFPYLGEPFPDMENAFPHLGEIFPQMENSFPHLGELIPHLENPFPNIVRTINRIIWEKKHVNSLTSKK